jgi:hypothetical protein
MLEGKDSNGYVWIRDLRYDDYYYLKDFEHLAVIKVVDFSENLSKEHWEAIVFEDEKCSQIIGRQEFTTKEEAQECLERLMELALKNRESV